MLYRILKIIIQLYFTINKKLPNYNQMEKRINEPAESLEEVSFSSMSLSRNVSEGGRPRGWSIYSRTAGKFSKLPPQVYSTYTKICDLHEKLEMQMNTITNVIGEEVQRGSDRIALACQRQLYKFRDEIEEYQKRFARLGRKDREVVAAPLNYAEELLKYDALCNSLKKRLEEMKTSDELLRKDNQFLEQQLKKAKKENRELQLLVQNQVEFRSHSALAMMPKSEEASVKPTVPIALHSGLFSEAELLKLPPSKIVTRCKQHFELEKSRLQQIIQNLQTKLESSNKKLARLINEKALQLANRNEIEQIFINCVEEVKKKISMERAKSGLKMQDKTTKDELKGNHKIQIMENFMMNDRLIKLLYDTIFKAQDKSKEKGFSNIFGTNTVIQSPKTPVGATESNSLTSQDTKRPISPISVRRQLLPRPSFLYSKTPRSSRIKINAHNFF